jgi:hypothetical protein
MNIVDFCTAYNDSIWKKTLNVIKSHNDELKNNYLNLSPTDFVCWPVLIDGDEIVCFSGLQKNVERWGDKFARINSRFFINPKFRHKGPGKLLHSEKFLNSRHLLPIQISKAKQLGFKGVFMSREGDHRKAFELYVDLAYRNSNHHFKVLNDRYNVCGSLEPIPESCKQWVAVHCFNNDMQLWFDEMHRYKIIIEKTVLS